VTLEPYQGETPRFTGPPQFTPDKVAWLHIAESAKGAAVRYLAFQREGDIAEIWRQGWGDYGIVVEAPDVSIRACWLCGMAKGIHVKGSQSTRGTIEANLIGPTVDSGVVMGSSGGVVRGTLIASNFIHGSYREDGIQCMQNFELPDAEQVKDVSNLGIIIWRNQIEGCNENAIDLKGAGQVIVAENRIRRIGGYSNGAPDFDPNKRSPMAIMHGARTSAGWVVIRDNDIQDSSGGIRLFPLWYIYHNRAVNCNYDPSGKVWAGVGFLQPGATPGAKLKNNLANGNLGGNYNLAAPTADFKGNQIAPGAALPLTTCKGAGRGVWLPVEDAGYFTDWMGRNLPPDVVYLSDRAYQISGIDYQGNRLQLDKEAQWNDGDPVLWRSPAPQVGPTEPTAPTTQPEPPTEPTTPIEPPTTPTAPPTEPTGPPAPPTAPALVRVTFTVDLAPGLAEALRQALASLVIEAPK
jgi:hypothetical protein